MFVLLQVLNNKENLEKRCFVLGGILGGELPSLDMHNDIYPPAVGHLREDRG